jgi:hypothetical protein
MRRQCACTLFLSLDNVFSLAAVMPATVPKHPSPAKSASIPIAVHRPVAGVDCARQSDSGNFAIPLHRQFVVRTRCASLPSPLPDSARHQRRSVLLSRPSVGNQTSCAKLQISPEITRRAKCAAQASGNKPAHFSLHT